MYNDLITQARLCTSQPPTGSAVSVLMCRGWLAKHVTDTPSLLLPPLAQGWTLSHSLLSVPATDCTWSWPSGKGHHCLDTLATDNTGFPLLPLPHLVINIIQAAWCLPNTTLKWLQHGRKAEKSHMDLILAVGIWKTWTTAQSSEILHFKRRGYRDVLLPEHILRGCVFWPGMIIMCVMSPGNLYNYQFHNLSSVWGWRQEAVWDMGTMGEVSTHDPASWLPCQPASYWHNFH